MTFTLKPDSVSMSVRFSKIRKFRFNLPQRIAALLLLAFLAQCLWIVRHQTLTEQDYDYARCGREMWERPSPLVGYFTSCGNIHDGVLAYRLAGLPLTLQFLAERGLDHLRRPENRVLVGQDPSPSSWEMRHQLTNVLLLLRLPFICAGLILGGELWWVTRRLFGNLGGYTALALYCFSPAILAATTSPSPEILTALGLFASIYTAIGVSHAMQGPRKKWRPRILLLTATCGVVAASHISALPFTLLIAFVFMVWLAEGTRTYILPILLCVLAGTFLLLFAAYGFSPDAFSYLFRSEAGRVSFSLASAGHLFGGLQNAGITLAAAASVILYLGSKRSRYFGNTAPLLVSLLILPLVTTGIPSQPWLWAAPFVVSFVGGVFADAYESSHQRIFMAASLSLIILQAGLSIAVVTQVLR
jgi:hypothetical protein